MDWKNSEYLDEEAFEQRLLGLGVTPEQLKEDLEDRLTLEAHPVCIEHCSFEKDGKKDLVYADGAQNPIGNVCITQWLKETQIEDLMWFWTQTEEKNKIKALMRYPGGKHEWLMLAAIPMLKEMEIPMEDILLYRTDTDKCFYYVNGQKCQHGGYKSTTMHNDLFEAIGNAYMKCVRQRRHHRMSVLQTYLRAFAEKYYCDSYGNFMDMPEALRILTGM